MIEIAQSINSFLPTEVVSIPVSILNTLVDQIQALTAKVKALERHQDESQETLNLNIAQDRKRLTALEIKEHMPQSAPTPGTKTAARIDMINQILKTHGATTLKELCRILKILPQELSRILRRLDKRRYDLAARPGDRRQKVLKLRAWNA